MAGSRRWCWTLNNYQDDELETVRNLYDRNRDLVRYLVYGFEVGESGTPHLQGFVVFKVPVRLERAKRLVGARCHFESARGTNQQASNYCKKEGEFEEFGSVPVGQGGKRTDIDEIIEWLDEFIADTGRAPTEREIALAKPQALLKYRDFLRVAQLRAPPPAMRVGDPRQWQRELESILDEPTDDERTVRFIVDEKGGSGKTWFQQYYMTKHPDRVQLLQPGKYIDMAYTIDASKDVFLINVPRGGMEFFHSNFRILESLKDRMVFSPKYQPQMKILQRVPHVVVFSNEPPRRDLLSSDRYNVSTLYNP